MIAPIPSRRDPQEAGHPPKTHPAATRLESTPSPGSPADAGQLPTGGRRSPHGQRTEHWFHFGPWVFSIDAAETLIAATPHERLALDVHAWATAYGLTRLDDPHPRAINLIGPTRDAVDRAHAMTTDLTRPVILGQISINHGPPAALLIDGVHRLYHAWRDNMPQLPAHLLTAEETHRIQHDVLLGPAGVTPPSA